MAQATPRRKRAWLAVLPNVLIPGLGYLYVGEKRLWFSVGLLVSSVIGFVVAFSAQTKGAEGWAFAGGAVLMAAVAWDVYQDVKALNERYRQTQAPAPSPVS